MRFCLIGAFFVWGAFISANVSSCLKRPSWRIHESERELPNGRCVRLPFPVKEVELGSSLFVPQGGVALLTPGSRFSSLVSGPLQPCAGIVIENTANGFKLLAHAGYKSKQETLEDYIRRLHVNKAEDVIITIYSYSPSEEKMKRTWASLLGSSSHFVYMQTLMHNVKAQVSKWQKIKEGDTGEATLRLAITPNLGKVNWGAYSEIPLTLGVDKRGVVFHPALFASCVLPRVGPRPPHLYTLIHLFIRELCQINDQLWRSLAPSYPFFGEYRKVNWEKLAYAVIWSNAY